MADRKRFASGAFQRNDRSTEENSQSPPSSDTEETTRKSHDQTVQQPTPMDVERTDRRTEIDQPQEERSDSQKTQLASSSTTNFVDCPGTVQVGSNTTSTVYNGPTYNYYFSNTHCHYHNQPPQQTEESSEYLRRIEQTAASSVNVNCKECLPYHHSNHPPLEGHTHTHPESPSRHIPERLPSHQCQQREDMESSERTHTTTHTDTANSKSQAAKSVDSSTSHAPRSSPIDVTSHFSRAEQRERNEGEAWTTGGRKNRKVVKLQAQHSDSSQTSPVSLEPAPEETRLLDRRGQALEPGDGVEIGGVWTMYVGNQEVVRCDRRTHRVERERLNLKKSFCKLRVLRWEMSLSPPPRSG